MSLIHEMCFEWLTRLWFTVDVTYQICMVEPWCGCSAEMAAIVSHTRGTHAFEVRLPGPSRCPRYIRGRRRVRHPQGRVLAASPPPGDPLARNAASVPPPQPRLPSQQTFHAWVTSACVCAALPESPRAAAASGAEKIGTRRAAASSLGLC